MIQIYSAENKDYDHNGDMTLLPEECSVHVVLNGEWTATLEHPIDDEGRWKYINDNAVVKMPSFNGEQLFRIKNKEKRDSGVSAELTPIFLDAKEDCFLLDVRPTEKNGQDKCCRFAFHFHISFPDVNTQHSTNRNIVYIYICF